MPWFFKYFIVSLQLLSSPKKIFKLNFFLKKLKLQTPSPNDESRILDLIHLIDISQNIFRVRANAQKFIGCGKLDSMLNFISAPRRLNQQISTV
jgi:hypothetical protein